MPNSQFPVANLTEKEVAEIKNYEKELNNGHPGSEKILIAYTKH